jgi:hypothetical protein
METASPELQRVILKALEKRTELRYGSMAELGRDLLPFVTNQHEAVIIVERIGRMFQRRATEIDDDPTTPLPAPRPVVAAPPAVAIRPDASTVDTGPGTRDKRWPELTPTTEPDVDIAHLVKERMIDLRPAAVPDVPPAPRIVDAVAPALVADPPSLPARAPSLAATTLAPEAKIDKDVGTSDDDTLFEVGSTHVPFSDRRGDDLAPTPLPLQPSRRRTPTRLAHSPDPRTTGARIVVILVVVALTVGVGMLAMAWILGSGS